MAPGPHHGAVGRRPLSQVARTQLKPLLRFPLPALAQWGPPFSYRFIPKLLYLCGFGTVQQGLVAPLPRDALPHPWRQTPFTGEPSDPAAKVIEKITWFFLFISTRLC